MQKKMQWFKLTDSSCTTSFHMIEYQNPCLWRLSFKTKKMHSGIEIDVFSFLCPLAISRCLPSRPLSQVVESGTAVSASLRGQQRPMLQSFANRNRETRTTVLLQTSSRRQGLQSLMNKKLKTMTAVLWKQKLENEDRSPLQTISSNKDRSFLHTNNGKRGLSSFANKKRKTRTAVLCKRKVEDKDRNPLQANSRKQGLRSSMNKKS